MNTEAHRAFLDRIHTRLETEPDVLGLVGLGSTSGEPPAPDAFSDHDLFVITRPGAQERFRTDLSWLPDPGSIVLSFRETAHGVKVLYASGHLVELAAFDLEEIALARVNRYRVVFDRADVTARLARVREASAAPAPAEDPRWLAGQLLTQLAVGAGRAARGERLSGHQLVRVSALGHLVALLRGTLPEGKRALLDDLDRFRRLERALPEVAAELDRALRLPVAAAARALLAVAARERPELVSPAARAAVEAVLGRAEEAAPSPPGAQTAKRRR
jgi:hypothetical protein